MLGERIAVIARPSEKLKYINKPPSSPYIIKMWLTAFYVLQNTYLEFREHSHF